MSWKGAIATGLCDLIAIACIPLSAMMVFSEHSPQEKVATIAVYVAVSAFFLSLGLLVDSAIKSEARSR